MKRALLSERIFSGARLLISCADLFAQLFFQRSRIGLCHEAVCDHIALKDCDRIALVHRIELVGSAIHALIIRAGVI